MLLSRRLDDKEIQLKNQSQIFFQISGAGHEAVLVAAGMTFRGGLRLVRAVLPRPRAVPGARRHAARHAAAGRRRQGRPGQSTAGRCRRTGAAARSISSRVAVRPARSACRRWACAEAGLLYQRDRRASPTASEHFHADEVVFCSLGDGATSEGEFWESLNTASQKRLPVVYLVEDNGYAISVPVEAQTPGGDISRLVERFPHLKVLRVDGCDFVASHAALQDAVQWARERQGPALVHAKVTRPYSHSLSDDERLYKTAAERADEAARDPLVRMRALLLAEGLATEDDLAACSADVDREIAEATDSGAGGRQARAPHGRRLGVSRPTSIRPRPRSTCRPSRRASPTRW